MATIQPLLHLHSDLPQPDEANDRTDGWTGGGGCMAGTLRCNHQSPRQRQQWRRPRVPARHALLGRPLGRRPGSAERHARSAPCRNTELCPARSARRAAATSPGAAPAQSERPAGVNGPTVAGPSRRRPRPRPRQRQTDQCRRGVKLDDARRLSASRSRGGGSSGGRLRQGKDRESASWHSAGLNTENGRLTQTGANAALTDT